MLKIFRQLAILARCKLFITNMNMPEEFTLRAFDQRANQAKEKLSILRDHVTNMQQEFSKYGMVGCMYELSYRYVSQRSYRSKIF